LNHKGQKIKTLNHRYQKVFNPKIKEQLAFMCSLSLA
jgi:hypothetical protein